MMRRSPRSARSSSAILRIRALVVPEVLTIRSGIRCSAPSFRMRTLRR